MTTANQEFKCSHCGQEVKEAKIINTSHRNHCPFCLWSKHVDLRESGDRKSECRAEMEPIGLIFKQEGTDKYGKKKQGELMIVHECSRCKKISINRIAGDDDSEAILKVFEESRKLKPEKTKKLQGSKIKLLTEDNRGEVFSQLFGARE